MIGVLLMGAAAGIAVGALLVHLLITQ